MLFPTQIYQFWDTASLRFFAIAKQRPRSAAVFLHSCSDNCSATFLKILGPGHQRSGHQVRSSDPTSEKINNRVTATVVEKDLKLSGFGILPSTYNLYISDFFISVT